MRKIYFTITFVFTALVVSFFFSSTAKAITVSPIRLELAADPGGSTEGKIKLFNEANQAQTYFIQFANFESKDESGQPTFVPGKTGIPSWGHAPESVNIGAKQFVEIPFTITPPSNAEPGGYFAAIFASKNAPSGDDAYSIALDSQAGTLIFFRVNGNFTDGEKVLEFNTKDKQKMFSQLPVEFFYRFQNSGADRIKPAGDITIKSIFGWTSKIINANPTSGSALPQSIRKFEASWSTGGGGIEEQPIQPERLKEHASFKESVVWQWNHLAIGLYKANLGVTINNDAARHYDATTSFWVIPWQLLSVIIGILLILGIPSIALITLIIVLRRKRNK